MISCLLMCLLGYLRALDFLYGSSILCTNKFLGHGITLLSGPSFVHFKQYCVKVVT